MLSRWQSSVGFVKTHIPDRLWNARPAVNALRSYSIKLIETGEEDGDEQDDEAEAEAEEFDDEGSEGVSITSPARLAQHQRAARVLKAFGSFFVAPDRPSRPKGVSSTLIPLRECY